MASLPIDAPLMTLADAQRLYERPALVQSVANGDATEEARAALPVAHNAAQRARAQALLDTALGVGIKAGMAWQLRNIRVTVDGLSRQLDLIYNFAPLMIRQRVAPPVISEARDLYNQEGAYAVRLSGAFYKIERQAAFTSVAPNWRAYLSFAAPPVDSTAFVTLLMPASSDEKTVWRIAIKNGWDQGVEQANLMLTQAMDRLNRDYSGMSRFQRFVVEGKISLPAIAREDIPLTQSGATLVLDETLLRLTTLPQFDSKLSRWQALVVSSNPRSAPKTAASPPSAEPGQKSRP
jgi:defect-in-organelle-trafficking protein DotC